MGYIPPVKDDQFIVYSNRMRKDDHQIPTLQPVQQISFLKTEDGNDSHYNKSKKRKHDVMNIAKYYENKLTGKGSYLDETI
ncbi:hypothetical protein QA612_16800 [Evansella sp. AB-P1]|uniref:hypothetical protein n=1 Tax=Evansella sp. AB-P1 TaxID=3037653 RepID=UPI00241F45CA|nr:hypothetical protein [Evansella sp. AB-P1]MDG5789118.1 hypothetical protein [Evansella sp. AB-P1]